MQDSNYNKRETDLMFKNVIDKLEDMHKDIKKTNGRVKALEIWRAFVLGGCAVILILGAWVVSDLENRIRSVVKDEISKSQQINQLSEINIE